MATADQEKKFKAFWGDGYHQGPITETVGIEKFTEAEGYDPASIAQVADLDVGEEADLSDPSGTHIVERMS